MTQTYRLEIYATEEDLPLMQTGIEEKLAETELADSVRVESRAIHYVEYGISPDDDSDRRPYIRIKNPAGKELFQTMDFLYKLTGLQSSTREYKEHYFERAVEIMKKDMGENEI